MTKEQAFKILGMEKQELLESNAIQELLSKKNEQMKRYDSCILDDRNGGKIVRVSNF